MVEYDLLAQPYRLGVCAPTTPCRSILENWNFKFLSLGICDSQDVSSHSTTMVKYDLLIDDYTAVLSTPSLPWV